jgi:histidine ammonia-lyase
VSGPVTISLTGSDLTIEDVAAVARGEVPVSLDPDAREAMVRARGVVDRALERGDEVYGLTTGVGPLKGVSVSGASEVTRAFDRSLIERHRVGQGPAAPPEVVRAMIVCLANTLARAYAGVRPVVIDTLLTLLDTREPDVRILGSVGQADLTANADLAAAIVDEVALLPGEGLALLNNSAFSVGWSALALAGAGTLLGAMEASAALALEGFAANPSSLHAIVAEARPYAGLIATLAAFHEHLEASALFVPGHARNLQDPLSFRNAAHVLGAARDALAFSRRQVSVELNAAQGNPLVLVGEDRVISVANFEALPVAVAMDALRLGIVPAAGASAERSVKLLEHAWSGLPTGLTPEDSDIGLAVLGIAAQAIAAEARSLAAPVSFDIGSSSLADGIEDRTTMAPLAARRTAELVALAERVTAIELVVAAQAVELRDGGPSGRGTSRTQTAVRELVPFVAGGDQLPQDMEPLVALVRSGRLSAEG